MADQAGRIAESIWPGENFGTTRSANAALKDLFDGKVYFDTPKPTQLIAGLIRLFSQDADYDDFTVMDFFSGSGTTAEAVMRTNLEDGAKRAHIQVQLPEPTAEDSAARKAGMPSIAAIARTRIELVGDKVLAELQGDSQDVGFRAYSLTDTNFSKWRFTSDVEPDKLEQRLLELRGSAEDAATPDALLTELLLKQGYSLTEESSDREVAGLGLRSVGEGLLLAYLDQHTKPSLEQLRAVVDEEPARLVILEDAFHGDDELKTNLAQLCKSKGVELWTA